MRISSISRGALTVCLTAALLVGCSTATTLTIGPVGEPGLLPQSVIITLSVVQRSFPEVTEEASTGRDSTASGSPKATRSVVYANGDESKKVTISVDQYATVSAAASAFRQAVRKSKKVPGFKPIHVPNLGRRTSAGTVTMNGETHIGIGVLTGTLIVGTTTAGYALRHGNVKQLVVVARAATAQATTILQ